MDRPHFQLARMLARLVFNLYFIRPRVVGRARLEKVEGPVLVISRRSGPVDPLGLVGYLPRPLCFLAPRSWSEVPVLGWISRTMGNLHLEPGQIPAELPPQALEVLAGGEEGALVVLHEPVEMGLEGEGRAFRLTARLAARTGVPVIPVHLEGAAWIGGPGVRLPRFGPLTLHVGAPIGLEFAGPDPNDEELDRAAGRMRAAVAGLADPEAGEAPSGALSGVPRGVR